VEVEELETKSLSIVHDINKIDLANTNTVKDEALKAKRSIQYQVGIQTLASTDLDFTGLGVESGMTIPLSGRLGLNTGFALNYLTRDSYFSPPFSRETGTNTGEPRSLVSLKQLYIPIGLNYSFSKYFALNSGVRVKYTYDEDLENNIWSRPTGLVLSTPYVDSDNFIDNTSIGLTAGVMLRLNNHFSILVDSEWRLSSLFGGTSLINAYRPSYNRNTVNLTTNYTF